MHGYAHLGVLLQIEARGLPVQVVAGTSVGALMGALWASGIVQYAFQAMHIRVNALAAGREALARAWPEIARAVLARTVARAPPRGRPLKVIYATAGGVSVALALAGLLLPLLPTTPFLLLASACFLRGSPAAHRWLHAHPRLGPCLTAFEQGRGIPARVKAAAIAMLWISMATTIAFLGSAWASAGLALLALAVTLYLLRLPTLAMTVGKSSDPVAPNTLRP